MITKEKFDPKRLEEGHELLLDFNKLKKVAQSREAVVAVAVQDIGSKDVLLVAYANEAALKYTLTHGIAAFWSTSREELWVKGATSGDTLEIIEVRVNCEQNSLLYRVRPLGQGVCHTEGSNGKTRKSCYYRRINNGQLEFVDEKGRKS